jgi:RNA polymerase sigma factor (sigma-70 family)
MTDDAELLRRYVEDRSEQAFAELVERHVRLVYSAALRQLGGATHRAEDVTQTVFIDLARRARTLVHRPDLSGWLYTSTHYAAAKLKRGEERRERREQEAHAMNEMGSEAATAAQWERLQPVLDEAMHGLGAGDREAILLRYFQAKRFAEVGERLGVTEDAARMRVERALDKLRMLLARRRITSTTAALGLLLANQPAVAVPAMLTATATSLALTGALAGASSPLALLFLMNTKNILLGTAAVIALGGAVYQFNEARTQRENVAALVAEREALNAQLRDVQSRVTAAEQQSAGLQREAQAARAAPATKAVAAVAASAATPVPGVLTEERSGFVFRAGAVDPAELRKQRRMLNGEGIDRSYAGLFRQLNWSPEQREQFKNLMLDAEESSERLFAKAAAAARKENPNLDRAGTFEIFEATRAQAQVEQQALVRQALGDAAGAAMERFQTTLPMRGIANQLATELFESDAPIAPAQTDQLVDLLARHARSPIGKVEVLALNADAAIAEAQVVLNPTQIAQLRRIIIRSQEQAKVDRERNTASAESIRAGAKLREAASK